MNDLANVMIQAPRLIVMIDWGKVGFMLNYDIKLRCVYVCPSTRIFCKEIHVSTVLLAADDIYFPPKFHALESIILFYTRVEVKVQTTPSLHTHSIFLIKTVTEFSRHDHNLCYEL